MYEEIQQLKLVVLELQAKINSLEFSQSTEMKGGLDDVQVERVFNADISGDPTTNTILRTVTVSVDVPDPSELPDTIDVDITVLDYPERFMIYTWKGQRLAIPVYDPAKLIIP